MKKNCTKTKFVQSYRRPKSFWNLLNKLDRKSNSENINLPCESFVNFYKKLNKKDDNNNQFHTNIINNLKKKTTRKLEF